MASDAAVKDRPTPAAVIPTMATTTVGSAWNAEDTNSDWNEGHVDLLHAGHTILSILLLSRGRSTINSEGRPEKSYGNSADPNNRDRAYLTHGTGGV